MKRFLQLPVVIIGFAIFAMMFGASNLIFPITVGVSAGCQLVPAVLGFLLTAVFLPLIGLITIMLFDGNYRTYFERIGRVPGGVLIVICMLIIGPLIGIPRSILLSYQMIQPFFPHLGFEFFSLLFLSITMLCALKEEYIVKFFGYVVGPLTILFLSIIIIKGVMLPFEVSPMVVEPWRVFIANVKYGFSTLDLLAAIFFGALLLTILKQTVKYVPRAQVANFALICALAGIIGSVLMAIAYGALMYLSSLHAVELIPVSEELLFTTLASYILGAGWWLFIVVTVLLVCISTSVALVSVVAHYLYEDVFNAHVGYIPNVIMVSILAFFAGYCGIYYIGRITYGPVALVLYPVVIVLTFCNLAYKVAGVRSVKVPVLLTFIGSLCVCLYFMFLR